MIFSMGDLQFVKSSLHASSVVNDNCAHNRVARTSAYTCSRSGCMGKGGRVGGTWGHGDIAPALVWNVCD